MFAFYKGCLEQWPNFFHNATPMAVDPMVGWMIYKLVQVIHNYEHILRDCNAAHQHTQQGSSSQASCCHPHDDTNSPPCNRCQCFSHSRSNCPSQNNCGACSWIQQGSSASTGSPAQTQGSAPPQLCLYAKNIPSHAMHNWADCIYNPASSNYDEPNFKHFCNALSWHQLLQQLFLPWHTLPPPVCNELSLLHGALPKQCMINTLIKQPPCLLAQLGACPKRL